MKGAATLAMFGQCERLANVLSTSGVARGATGAMAPPQTFGECFFSPINLRRYVLLVCK